MAGAAPRGEPPRCASAAGHHGGHGPHTPIGGVYRDCPTIDIFVTVTLSIFRDSHYNRTMKDAHDTSTADMHPTPPRRGRPPTGKAKSAAQRKREQRERDRTRPVEEWTLETLLQAVATATQAGDVQKLAAGCAELKRRAEAVTR